MQHWLSEISYPADCCGVDELPLIMGKGPAGLMSTLPLDGSSDPQL